MRWPARPNNEIVIQASNPRIPKTGGLCLAQTGDAGAGGVCFDAGQEGTGGRGARPPGSSKRGVYFVLDRPGARTGRRAECRRRHGPDLEALEGRSAAALGSLDAHGVDVLAGRARLAPGRPNFAELFFHALR
jgi:hypothetical protein